MNLAFSTLAFDGQTCGLLLREFSEWSDFLVKELLLQFTNLHLNSKQAKVNKCNSHSSRDSSVSLMRVFPQPGP